MEKPARLPALTSLRFIAAMMIVGLHASNYFPEAAFLALYPLRQGVSFFFVLSGFVLSHAYATRSIDFWAFAGSRLARLWPVHLITLIAVLTLIRPDSRQFPGTGFFDPWIVLASNLTLTHSLVPYVNYTFSWNAVSWSISTEMFFYLAFPLLLIGIGKNWPWKLAGTIGIIGGYALAARIFAIPPTSPDPLDLTITYLTYASPLFRSFEFVLGMAVYVHWKRMNAAERVGTRIEAAMIAGLVLWLVVGWHHAAKLFEREPTLEIWYASAGSSLVCAAAIYVFAGGRGVIGRLLSLKAFVWLGEISFALYMCHQIIMKWLFLQNLEGKLTLPPLWVAILICIAAAAALHHLVEKPAQWALNDLGRSLRSRRSAKLAAQLQ